MTSQGIVESENVCFDSSSLDYFWKIPYICVPSHSGWKCLHQKTSPDSLYFDSLHVLANKFPSETFNDSVSYFVL